MKFVNSLVAGLSLVLLIVAVARAEEKEEKVPLDKLPKAAVDAVKARYPDAELVGAEKEKEAGKLLYEVTIKNKGQKIEIMVTPEGKITLIEKTIDVKTLPKVVTEAVAARYPRATLESAEEIIKGDKITAYEVVLVTADKKKLEVEFEPSGKLLKEEKKKEE